MFGRRAAPEMRSRGLSVLFVGGTCRLRPKPIAAEMRPAAENQRW
jgi:hypothetical protein